jgi:hypothetical protein
VAPIISKDDRCNPLWEPMQMILSDHMAGRSDNREPPDDAGLRDFILLITAFGYGLVAGVLHGASPSPVWPVGKLSLGLDQFSGPTSLPQLARRLLGSIAVENG